MIIRVKSFLSINSKPVQPFVEFKSETHSFDWLTPFQTRRLAYRLLMAADKAQRLGEQHDKAGKRDRK